MTDATPTIDFDRLFKLRLGACVEMARRKGTLWQREKGPLCRVVAPRPLAGT